jgi:transcriptional regulator with XRE-family HTH domain
VDKMPDDAWGPWVRRKRLERKLTQYEVADYAEEYAKQRGGWEGLPPGARLTQSDISNFEEGTRPKLAKLRTFVEVLQLDWVDTALAYIGIDPDDAEVRRWKPSSLPEYPDLDRLLAAQPTGDELRRLVDVLETLRFWGKAPGEAGNMVAERRGRRLRSVER